MKVLKEGNPAIKKNANETMKVVCKHCEAELEIIPKDIIDRGTIFPSFAFECPECKGFTNIKLKDCSSNFKYWVTINNDCY